jgi:chorismate mutase/prephenate dehydratase
MADIPSVKRTNVKNPSKRLTALRKEIDRLDAQLVSLLNRRARAALSVKKVKEEAGLPFFAPHRESEVHRRAAALNKGPFPSDALKAVLSEVISGCMSLETRLKVAYMGPRATNTHLAAIRRFGTSSELLPVPGIKEVFLEVERGRAQFGVVPIENSTEGVVNHTLDLFVDSELRICAEILMPITYTIMSRSGDLSRVKRVYSHPQGFAQTRLWIETNLPGVRLVDSASTARGAQQASGDPHAAAIAPELAARLYGLRPIARNIEDISDNVTRFLVIAPQGTRVERTGRDKTSIMVSIKDRVGALYNLLTPFHRRDLNLTSIESRPSRRKAWDYYFFMDFQGHVDDPKVRAALKDLENISLFAKVLGSYPRSEA